MAALPLVGAAAAAAPHYLVHKSLSPSDSKCITKCRRIHAMKVESKHTHETKTQKSIVKESVEFKRRDFVALVGLAVCGPAQLARAQDMLCQLKVARSGLGYCDTLIGNGVEASQGQLIKAHYTGKLENGKVFDSSYNRGQPLTFRVGVGEVIKGWDQGILGGDGIPPMLAGGKRTLKIPPELGYGVRGAGCRGGSCVIPPNSVLLFDVEFVGKT